VIENGAGEVFRCARVYGGEKLGQWSAAVVVV
jgi:hypothetical protein